MSTVSAADVRVALRPDRGRPLPARRHIADRAGRAEPRARPARRRSTAAARSLRDGMGQIPGRRNADGVLDLVITSVIVMDPVLGILKADIGVKDGLIAGIGQAGNPYVQDGVDPNLVDRRRHRGDLRRGPGRDGRRRRHARPLPDAGSGAARALERRHDPDRRRNRPCGRLAGHDLHARARGTSPACSRRPRSCRSTSACSARATAAGRRRSPSSSTPAPAD